MYYNARSLLPKVNELAATAKVLQPTIICVVETWLSDQDTDPEISIEGFFKFFYFYLFIFITIYAFRKGYMK